MFEELDYMVFYKFKTFLANVLVKLNIKIQMTLILNYKIERVIKIFIILHKDVYQEIDFFFNNLINQMSRYE